MTTRRLDIFQLNSVNNVESKGFKSRSISISHMDIPQFETRFTYPYKMSQV